MPQEFHVLRCFACEIFQVHQTKKDKKWACKVCGEKQSLKKAYFRGSGRDCRSVVQKLNLENGEKKSGNETHQSEEFEVENEVKDSVNFETMLEESNNQEENIVSSDCYNPSKKQRRNEYATSPPIEKIVNPSFVKAHHTETQVLPEVGSTSSSDICFDLGFDYPISPTNENRSSTVNVQDHHIKDGLSEKPKVTKNRGFQMILKAAQNLS